MQPSIRTPPPPPLRFEFLPNLVCACVKLIFFPTGLLYLQLLKVVYCYVVTNFVWPSVKKIIKHFFLCKDKQAVTTTSNDPPPISSYYLRTTYGSPFIFAICIDEQAMRCQGALVALKYGHARGPTVPYQPSVASRTIFNCLTFYLMSI